jgi:hypothetical protein
MSKGRKRYMKRTKDISEGQKIYRKGQGRHDRKMNIDHMMRGWRSM